MWCEKMANHASTPPSRGADAARGAAASRISVAQRNSTPSPGTPNRSLRLSLLFHEDTVEDAFSIHTPRRTSSFKERAQVASAEALSGDNSVLCTLCEYRQLLERVDRDNCDRGLRGHDDDERGQRTVSCMRLLWFSLLTALTLFGELALVAALDPGVYSEVQQFDYVLRYSAQSTADRNCSSTAPLTRDAGASHVRPYVKLIDLQTGLEAASPGWGVTAGDTAFEIVQFELRGLHGADYGSLYHFAAPLYLQFRPFILRTFSLGSYTLRLARVGLLLVEEGSCGALAAHPARIELVDHIARQFRGGAGVTAEVHAASNRSMLGLESIVGFACSTHLQTGGRAPERPGLPIDAMRSRACTPQQAVSHSGQTDDFVAVTATLVLLLGLAATSVGVRLLVKQYAAVIERIRPEFLLSRADIPGHALLDMWQAYHCDAEMHHATQPHATPPHATPPHATLPHATHHATHHATSPVLLSPPTVRPARRCVEICVEASAAWWARWCGGWSGQCCGPRDDDQYDYEAGAAAQLRDPQAFMAFVVNGSCPFFIVDSLVADPHDHAPARLHAPTRADDGAADRLNGMSSPLPTEASPREPRANWRPRRRCLLQAVLLLTGSMLVWLVGRQLRDSVAVDAQIKAAPAYVLPLALGVIWGVSRHFPASAWIAARTAPIHWALIAVPGVPLTLFAIMMGCERDNEFEELPRPHGHSSLPTDLNAGDECETRPSQMAAVAVLVLKDVGALIYASCWYLGRGNRRTVGTGTGGTGTGTGDADHDGIPYAWRWRLAPSSVLPGCGALWLLWPWLLTVTLSLLYVIAITLWLLLTLLVQPIQALCRLGVLAVVPTYLWMTYRQLLQVRTDRLDDVLTRAREMQRAGHADDALVADAVRAQIRLTTDLLLELGLGALLLLGVVCWVGFGFSLLSAHQPNDSSVLQAFMPTLATAAAAMITTARQTETFTAAIDGTRAELKESLDRLEAHALEVKEMVSAVKEKVRGARPSSEATAQALPCRWVSCEEKVAGSDVLRAQWRRDPLRREALTNACRLPRLHARAPAPSADRAAARFASRARGRLRKLHREAAQRHV